MKIHWSVMILLPSLISISSAALTLADDAPVQLKIGDEAPEWSDLIGTDDEKHSLADLKDSRVIVVCFTCNSCPYSVDYEDRMIEFDQEFGGQKKSVALIAINSNARPTEQLDRMKERAKARGFPFLYLKDDTQKVATTYGANFTPEFFVLNEKRQIVYIGAMDDRTEADKVQQRFVQLAVAAALKGELPATTTHPARGCAIAYKRTRR